MSCKKILEQELYRATRSFRVLRGSFSADAKLTDRTHRAMNATWEGGSSSAACKSLVNADSAKSRMRSGKLHSDAAQARERRSVAACWSLAISLYLWLSRVDGSVGVNCEFGEYPVAGQSLFDAKFITLFYTQAKIHPLTCFHGP